MLFVDPTSTVRITTSRAIFGATTYALRNLTSVSARSELANRSGPNNLMGLGVLLIVFAVVSGLGCGSAAGIASGIGAFFFFAFVGGTMSVIGYIWNQSILDYYSVRIASAGGEHDVHRSSDKHSIDRIVHAINEAMARRG